MKSIRDKRQQEFADIWLKEKHGILNLCPRFGKIFTTINALEKMPDGITILIAYPDVKIKDSWQTDFEKRRYYNPNITYTTHLSLKKYVDYEFDVIIIDEIHLLSDAQLDAAEILLRYNECVLGLTGTLSVATEREIEERLDLHVIAHYPIELAIQEGVIVDYEINVIKVPLDNTVMVKYKTKTRTEKQQFDSYAWVIDQLERQNRNTMFLRLARMRIIQNSLSKLNATKALLKKCPIILSQIFPVR
jgi:superfamily II DNA or RNA helicase